MNCHHPFKTGDVNNWTCTQCGVSGGLAHDIGKRCPGCTGLIGYMHDKGCAYEADPGTLVERTVRQVETIMDRVASGRYSPARSRAWDTQYETIFEMSLSDYDLSLLRGMKIAVNWSAR